MLQHFNPAASPIAALRETVFKRLIHLAESPPASLPSRLEDLAHPQAQWRVSHPMNQLVGNEAALAVVYGPLKAAFPDLERRDVIFVGGTYKDKKLIAALGHYCGTMNGDWLGIPATNKPTYLRYGEVYEIDDDGRVIQANQIGRAHV